MNTKYKNFYFLFAVVLLLTFLKIDFRFTETIYCCSDDFDYFIHTETISEDFDFDYSNQLKGYENEKDYIVSFDDNNELAIVKKDNVVRLRSSETNLHQLANVKKDDWDIRVLVYAGNNKLVVEVNPLSIRKLSNMTFNKKIVIDDKNDLSLYIVKHNNPDYLNLE